MRTKRIIKNFQSRVDYACGNDDLRPVMSNIYFENGFLYATDAHIAIKQSLRLHQFEDSEIEILNGKMIHRKQFMEIYKHDLIRVEEDGILCRSNGIKVKYLWSDSDNKFPSVEKVLQDSMESTEIVPTNSIFASVSLIAKFKDIFVFDNYGHGCELHFKKDKKAILLTPCYYDNRKADQIGLLMPVDAKSKFM